MVSNPRLFGYGSIFILDGGVGKTYQYPGWYVNNFVHEFNTPLILVLNEILYTLLFFF